MSQVCSVDGAAVAQARNGRWVHTDSLPDWVDPEHEIDPVESRHFVLRQTHELGLREAATDMLRHHDTIHPGSDCEWSRNLMDALRRT